MGWRVGSEPETCSLEAQNENKLRFWRSEAKYEMLTVLPRICHRYRAQLKCSLEALFLIVECAPVCK